MERLLLIDGHNLLFQMFYGLPPRIVGRRGQPIQAAVGFVGGLLKMLRMVQPTHLLVAFDGEEGSDRLQIAPDYKAGRKDYQDVPLEENPFSQLPLILAALSEMGVCFFESSGGLEADDVIAAYVREKPAAMQAVIASSDRDYLQLLSSSVSLLVYRGKQSKWYDPDTVEEMWGIRPDQYAAFKAMVGDPSDHIQGVPRIGPKTAAKLLRQFGTTEKLLGCLTQVNPGFVQEALWEHREVVERNLALIKLDRRLALPYSFEALRVTSGISKRSGREILDRVDR